MLMYPKHDLYEKYKSKAKIDRFSSSLPNVTSYSTLQNINYAINLCEKWDHCTDIGGGSGHYLSALVEKFKKGTLVEVEKLPEHSLLESKASNIKIIHSFIEDYQTSEKTDFILLADIFEHIPDIKKFVSKISTMQNTGGVIYIMTPNPVYCGPAPESGLYYTRHPNGHIKHYTTNEICDHMKNSGYRLELSFYEETELRQKIKWYIFGVSRYDKSLRNNFLYQIIRPLVLLINYPIFYFLGKISHWSETKNRHNELTAMTQNLVFKKVE